ncbi:Asp-tRNA(Asn)/Glu-tRNA(Gln) amidotransferase subunit GatC [Leuconostoc carnosum]|uniref:Aspartyl/glutamyl-tRNA(Asn/Gln) amidotransferase subunit C n=1 Tax=Leuconostoc carnosum (strain JB16) TaxID=1229758 RepID=K0DCT3_LEUCJ|nr:MULTISPECIES: Asp-tRNA(Asn)/Glu-tRNA(Gln) amidotransferase subunit GatC [Leuconostoc]AFT81307.1 glutamyl-tRNA amidotransferase subunit C [Leuconostoc carnosum JB16]KAA8326639.1 Asp-tRNA(Asn)/Glu-tRNA(Gln) amidotransferase subunit GatC [Leuconostoc carnosum]KAA8330126.1 Asp-tRNA(Asn)/Glu-tRNA(Gln) amidotransferase subunit GatC [Leuconostoc carnosum]KAA8362200.1 Asp-tRNA(Asn)/Glu-tRNA(Gln) amidotransferase subunit GatC [Leuconostoc carnosum]KAA8366749.1 Asp-tRNA(Asn)/Glu-tRNA(Gln) amidotransf
MSETTISKEEVAHVASLAKLAFNDAELEQFTTQLSDILNIFNTLSEVDTDNVEPTYSVTENINHLRDDIADNWHQKEALLSNASSSAADLIKVPAILDGEGK